MPRRGRKKKSKTTKVVTTVSKQSPDQNLAPRRARRVNRRTKQKGTAANLPASIGMSKCAREYAVALVNPFGSRKTDPCIPDNLPTPSFRFQSRSRGVFSTSMTTGVGWVIFNPWQMIHSGGSAAGALTDIPVLYTSPTYNASALNWLPTAGVFPTGVNPAFSNSAFDPAFFGLNTKREFRLVAAGLRVSYTGSNFRNQGRVIIYRTQGNINIPNGDTQAAFLQSNYTVVLPVRRQTEYLFYTPDSQDLLSFNEGINYSSILSGQIQPPLGGYAYTIFVEGGDLDVPQSWLFEATSYFECIGANLTLSPGESDSQGMGQVLAAMPNKAPTVSPSEIEHTVFNRIMAKASEAAGAAAQMGITYLRNTYLPNNNYARALPYVTVDEV